MKVILLPYDILQLSLVRYTHTYYSLDSTVTFYLDVIFHSKTTFRQKC